MGCCDSKTKSKEEIDAQELISKNVCSSCPQQHQGPTIEVENRSLNNRFTVVVGKAVDQTDTYFKTICRVNRIFDFADVIINNGPALTEDPQFTTGIYVRWHMGRVIPGTIYDGDTFTKGTVVEVPVDIVDKKTVPSFRYPSKSNTVISSNINVRLYGYNSAEIRQPVKLDADTRKRNKELAILARNKLKELCENHILTAVFVDNIIESHGRLLCVVYREDKLNINREMIRLGYGEYYDGR